MRNPNPSSRNKKQTFCKLFRVLEFRFGKHPEPRQLSLKTNQSAEPAAKENIILWPPETRTHCWQWILENITTKKHALKQTHSHSRKRKGSQEIFSVLEFSIVAFIFSEVSQSFNPSESNPIWINDSQRLPLNLEEEKKSETEEGVNGVDASFKRINSNSVYLRARPIWSSTKLFSGSHSRLLCSLNYTTTPNPDSFSSTKRLGWWVVKPNHP